MQLKFDPLPPASPPPLPLPTGAAWPLEAGVYVKYADADAAKCSAGARSLDMLGHVQGAAGHTRMHTSRGRLGTHACTRPGGGWAHTHAHVQGATGHTRTHMCGAPKRAGGRCAVLCGWCVSLLARGCQAEVGGWGTQARWRGEKDDHVNVRFPSKTAGGHERGRHMWKGGQGLGTSTRVAT
eukprot:365017-Chlamydomonas_euryale.AAC.7